ncbi:citrate lyase subunit beta / citryl-CoA lyase [Promicromonospora thailandica]|uniref:Citrate lyase subunit beta / citryl-CoA lyase n=1 Tax=Promicromonospora thailandica TaxID=765201 RepID=A0A9X2G7K7_9MICO|nr:citrate lyase subunit beta / citryl-CoA lyase [Promicromonospora thailandica]BFF21989.1 CoA ester lyase [Promicromonospora thailandica]
MTETPADRTTPSADQPGSYSSGLPAAFAVTPESDLTARRAAREKSRVAPDYARAWLLLSAMRTELFDKAQLSRADQVILDCEDAIDDSLKDEARENVIRWIKSGGCAWVRINDRTAPSWADDVAYLRGLDGLNGVMLAKTESADDVIDTAQRLGGDVPVIPLVESALGIEEAVHIAKARGAFRLAFGSGDYRRDTGAANEPMAMAYPRTRLVLASRIGGLPGPVDGPTVGSSHALLREQSADAVNLGMTGKLCLDFEQSGVINESFAPSPSDVAWAVDFFAEFEAAGSVIRDGSDKPRLARAQVIRSRAELFGINPA